MYDLHTKKLPGKASIYWRSILIILILAIFCCLQGCKVDNKHGAATPDRVVEQYLLALEHRNHNLMMRLAPETAAVGKQIKARIDRLGGHEIKDRQISYVKPKPSLWNAKIHGFVVDRLGQRQVFDDSISIEYQSKGQVKLYGGRWYLLL
jgi:hypothetical protein